MSTPNEIKPIEPGDVVCLRSDSARMTVGSIKDGIATLYWFTDGHHSSSVNRCAVEVGALFHYAPGAP